jgi:hypothetical protein
MSQMEILEAARLKYGADKVQPGVLNILAPGDEFLQDLVDRFVSMWSGAKKAQVACFIELKPSDVGMIVGEEHIVGLENAPVLHWN